MDESQDFMLLLRTLPRDWRTVIDQRLAPLGLSQAKWKPLLYLMRAEKPLTQTEIARLLDIESPTLVRLLDRLESDGWIVRKACPADRRIRHVLLTPRAKRVCVKIEEVVQDVRVQLMADVTPAEVKRCVATLRRVHAAALRLMTERPELESGESGESHEPQNGTTRANRIGNAAGTSTGTVTGTALRRGSRKLA